MTKITVDKALIEQAMLAIFPVMRYGLVGTKDTQQHALQLVYAGLTAALKEPVVELCHCKDRKASECPGEWEPGCDLGNNEAHCKPAPVTFTHPEDCTHEEMCRILEIEQGPVYWEWRWFDANPNTVTFGQWSEWKRVEPRNALCTVEDSLNEFRTYIASGQRYEIRALYTHPVTPLSDEQIARAWAGGDHNASAATKRRITRAIEAEIGVMK